MRSTETQTELLESSSDEGGSSEDVASAINDELEGNNALDQNHIAREDEPGIDDNDDDEDDDDDYEDILDEEAKLKSIKRLNCSNLFSFNKLELLNERCSVAGPQQISDSSRNLCDHEVHVAVDEELETVGFRSKAGEGKRTTECAAGSSSAVFIQESPEVIL